ncbi:MAG: DUF2877 domain-containing protein [Alphaproteobacteria bacterium]|jgi:hypothetical protein|nr:DUF2877 domain-containing protein [Alphaproteobacteria bacterium]
MADGYDSNQFAITSAGKLALDAIDYPKQGRVAAIFERSFYIQVDDHWICLGASSLTLGPLNLLTDAPANINWQASGLRLEDQVKISATHIHIGNRFAFSYRDAEPWQPDSITVLNTTTVAAGLTTLTQQAHSMAPTEGLASFIFPDGSLTTALPTAAPAIAEMTNFVGGEHSNAESILEPVTALIGLGPGLTPSGDDFLGGTMIALSILGEKEKLRCLENVVGEAGSATNDISRAHLKAAAQGIGAEPLHATIGAIISNQDQPLRDSLERLGAIGHCSGWDALTGVVITLRAWLEK